MNGPKIHTGWHGDWTEKQSRRKATQEFIDALDGETSPLNPDQPPKAMSPRTPERRWAAVGTVGRPEERFALEPEQPAGDAA